MALRPADFDRDSYLVDGEEEAAIVGTIQLRSEGGDGDASRPTAGAKGGTTSSGRPAPLLWALLLIPFAALALALVLSSRPTAVATLSPVPTAPSLAPSPQTYTPPPVMAPQFSVTSSAFQGQCNPGCPVSVSLLNQGAAGSALATFVITPYDNAATPLASCMAEVPLTQANGVTSASCVAYSQAMARYFAGGSSRRVGFRVDIENPQTYTQPTRSETAALEGRWRGRTQYESRFTDGAGERYRADDSFTVSVRAARNRPGLFALSVFESTDFHNLDTGYRFTRVRKGDFSVTRDGVTIEGSAATVSFSDNDQPPIELPNARLNARLQAPDQLELHVRWREDGGRELDGTGMVLTKQ